MNIVITGASSGIGEALAYEYAKRGGHHLFLCGRNVDRLNAVAVKCRDLGAVVDAEPLDVSEENPTRDWLRRCEEKAPLDLVYSNAGVATGKETEANVRRAFAVNVGGAVNTVLPAIEIFRASPERERRQIVITASIAGYHGLSSCPSYSATKSCVKQWGAALRGQLAREGIRVNVICPGFVRSRITDQNTCPMPFFWEADKAARVIISRVDRNVPLIAFPWPMRFATWLGSILPERLSELFYKILPKKNKDV